MANVELFEQMAGRYDTEERAETAKIIADAIRRHVGNAGGKCAIDYGCGTGLVGLHLADLFDSILLADAAEAMVEQVLRKIETAGIKTATAACMDLESADVGELKTDYVILAQVLLHIPDVLSMLARLRSLLSKGGHLLIVDFDKDEAIVSDKVHNGFDQGELMRLCRSAGFSDVAAHTFYRGKNLFMGRDASMFLLDAVN